MTCMEHEPTFTPFLWPGSVGKYHCSTMVSSSGEFTHSVGWPNEYPIHPAASVKSPCSINVSWKDHLDTIGYHWFMFHPKTMGFRVWFPISDISLWKLYWSIIQFILVGGWATPPKNISRLGWFLSIYGKIKHIPNHQPVIVTLYYASKGFSDIPSSISPFLPMCWVEKITKSHQINHQSPSSPSISSIGGHI